ncbi:MAG: RNA polymerase sigma factor [Deltaproteobacteria bacterium]|nr:RNA polymerase sigma factor [Deltaproteobacteria bacterium]
MSAVIDLFALDDLLGWIQLSIAVPLRASTVAGERDPDRPLIDRVLGGDRRAASDLFRRHADDVYRRLTRLVGPDPEREDLVQEVFVAAFRGLDRFRGDSSFSTWLYRVVVHVAYGHLRRRRRRPLDLDAAIERVPLDPALTPEALAARQQQLARAMRFLDRLKPDKRIAFVLRTVEGMSLQEIAVVVEAKPAAVGQRVKHAQRELAAMIQRDERRRAREVGR